MRAGAASEGADGVADRERGAAGVRHRFADERERGDESILETDQQDEEAGDADPESVPGGQHHGEAEQHDGGAAKR